MNRYESLTEQAQLEPPAQHAAPNTLPTALSVETYVAQPLTEAELVGIGSASRQWRGTLCQCAGGGTPVEWQSCLLSTFCNAIAFGCAQT